MRYTQPQSGPAPVDTSHPLAKGLVLAVNPGTSPFRDMAGRTAVRNGISVAPGSRGIGYQAASNSSLGAQFATSPMRTSDSAYGGDFTYLVIANPIASTTREFFVCCQSGIEEFYFGANFNVGLAATSGAVNAQTNAGAASGVTVSGAADGNPHVYAYTRAGATGSLYVDGALGGTATVLQALIGRSTSSDYIGGYSGAGWGISKGVFLVLGWYRALSAAEVKSISANPWQLFRSPQRVMVAAAGGTDTPVNPGVGALALAGYAPSVTQSANLSLSPSTGSIGITGYAPSISQPQAITAGAGAITLTGYAPTVTQGITTSIVPGAGALNLTGYAPSIAQSANQSVMPDAGSLSISGYVPAIAQTANQSIAPAPGSLTLTGYAPTVAQALASPNLVPEVGVLSIIGYAPTVEQRAPITKIGGDDAPRHDEEDERVEVWEKRAPTPRRDDSLDKVIREAYAKAIGKSAAPAVAKAEPKPVALDEPAFDFNEEDDLEVLLLSF